MSGAESEELLEELRKHPGLFSEMHMVEGSRVGMFAEGTLCGCAVHPHYGMTLLLCMNVVEEGCDEGGTCANEFCLLYILGCTGGLLQSGSGPGGRRRAVERLCGGGMASVLQGTGG
jgi:hypothetical protein